MKPILTLALALTFLTTLPPACPAAETAEDVKQSEEYKIGVMVQAIAAALKAPEKPASLETITAYGTDSRYYVMIRGWLSQEKQGTESQLNATRDPAKKAKFQQKVDFLGQCLRRIDLE
ncbi:MAG: hypothetical protein H7A51_01130 [Akkermansiaceae bacterium]|nr:hypothetical protein [Akkermansiaceae bacterium]